MEKRNKGSAQQNYVKPGNDMATSGGKSNDPYQKYKDFQWENPDQFKNGPVGDDTRKCRDCICCIIFIILFLACIFVGVYGFKKGEPTSLLYTYDEDGNACGKTDEYKEYKYLYFYSIVSGLTSLSTDAILKGICVKSCPNKSFKNKEEFENAVQNENFKLDCKSTKNNQNCKIEYKNYYESEAILDRLCFPKKNNEIEYDPDNQIKVKIFDPKSGESFEKVVDKEKTYTDADSSVYILQSAIDSNDDPQASASLINVAFFSQKFSSYLSDLTGAKYAIAASILWSFVITMIFMLFLRLCAGVITFIIIVLIQAGLIVLAVFFKFQMDEKEEAKDSTYETVYKVLFYIFIALAVIWFIFIMAMCNRIRLAISLIQVTSKYIMKNCCIIFVPFIFFILLMAWVAYWLVMIVFIYTSGKFDKEGSTVMASYKMDNEVVYLFWYHIFTLFYITAIISAYSQFVYASCACIWYFTYEKGTENHPILKSFWRGLRYHFGSIVFGATIIAIIRFIMVFLEYVKKKIEGTVGKKQGKCLKCIISCFQCCLGCCAKCMEYINKHAYIQIALKGDNFCTAAFEGFGLVIRNLGRFAMLGMFSGILSIFGTIFISISSAVIGYFVITKVDYFSVEVNSVVLPVIAFGVVGFILGYISMSIFSVSGDALIHSFLLDEEINKGQPKAFPELQKFMSDER